jgi:exosortase A
LENVRTAQFAQLGMPKFAIIGAVLLLPFLAYFATAQSIVAIWNSSETFAHGYVILPISLWLIWRRRDVLKTLPIEPYWPAMFLLAACGFAWLLGEVADVQIVKQYAFAAMLPVSTLAILGKKLARAMTFPLLFTLFAVPFGDIFIEPLINFTADFAIAALRATGIPVLREGNSFSIPTGNWSVVEACSGVRYLISSITLGCLYAYLTYRTRWRQAIFVVFSILVPIAANGVRAYMIVMIGHLSGMKLAVGFDHLIYGWIFFGIVMFLLFWLGSFWREDVVPKVDTPTITLSSPSQTLPSPRLLAAACAILLSVGVWPAYAHYIETANSSALAAQLSAFQPTWKKSQTFSDWRPSFSPSNAELREFYEKDDRPIGLDLLYYRNQQHGAELISSNNQLATSKDHVWHHVGTILRTENIGGRTLTLREATISGPGGHLLVWYWYWIDGSVTTNDYVGKLLQAKQKLLNGRDDCAAVMVFAPFDEKPDMAREVLRDFLGGNMTPIESLLASNRQ